MPRQRAAAEAETEGDGAEAGVDDATRQILAAVLADRPSNLIELRGVVDGLPIEPSLLEATLWSLIDDRTIQLNPDRTISVPG